MFFEVPGSAKRFRHVLFICSAASVYSVYFPNGTQS
jgi:hypothetical protein